MICTPTGRPLEVHERHGHHRQPDEADRLRVEPDIRACRHFDPAQLHGFLADERRDVRRRRAPAAHRPSEQAAPPLPRTSGETAARAPEYRRRQQRAGEEAVARRGIEIVRRGTSGVRREAPRRSSR